MRAGVLGTGMVGRAHAARLAVLGHQVTIGTRDVLRATGVPAVDTDRSTTEGETFAEWSQRNPEVRVQTYAEACSDAAIVIVALNGQVVIEVLSSIQDELEGTVVVDITNAVDFSTGELRLFVCNTDSLGERVQQALPQARVVKTLCTVTAEIQVDPTTLGNGEHDMFIAGDDQQAKESVSDLLGQYGWQEVVDLGDITASRGMEMMLPMWLRIMQTSGTMRFNYRLVVDRNS